MLNHVADNNASSFSIARGLSILNLKCMLLRKTTKSNHVHIDECFDTKVTLRFLIPAIQPSVHSLLLSFYLLSRHTDFVDSLYQKEKTREKGRDGDLRINTLPHGQWRIFFFFFCFVLILHFFLHFCFDFSTKWQNSLNKLPSGRHQSRDVSVHEFPRRWRK